MDRCVCSQVHDEHSNEDICPNELQAHEPVGVAIGGDKLGVDDSQQEDEDQEGVEGQRELLARWPSL